LLNCWTENKEQRIKTKDKERRTKNEKRWANQATQPRTPEHA